MSLVDPTLLWLGAGLTALALVGVWSHFARRRRLAEFLGGRRAAARFSRRDLYGLGIGRALLLGLAGIALATAAAEPRWIEAPRPEAPPKDRVILAIDVSASMQAVDASPTRLAQAVARADELLGALGGQEVGLLLFAGTTYPLAPPTLDHHALSFLLGGVAPTMASAYDPGTLISVALRDATSLLERTAPLTDGSPGEPPRGRKRIVLIGDGDGGESEDSLRAAVDAARAVGITVHVIGMGTEEGAGMSLPAGDYQLGGPVLDARGARGRSRLREGLLQGVASAGGGRYARADDESDLGAIRDALTAPPTPAEADAAEETRPDWTRYDLRMVLGFAALLLVVAESLLDVTLPRLRSLRPREVT